MYSGAQATLSDLTLAPGTEGTGLSNIPHTSVQSQLLSGSFCSRDRTAWLVGWGAHFTASFNKYLPITCFVPDTESGSRDRWQTRQNCDFHRVFMLEEELLQMSFPNPPRFGVRAIVSKASLSHLGSCPNKERHDPRARERRPPSYPPPTQFPIHGTQKPK